MLSAPRAVRHAAGHSLSQRPGAARDHFRTLTAMSPLQYQKQLRLQAARARMLVDGLDAASAAFEVGYESASEFNREYRRFFGKPPMRDIQALRLANEASSLMAPGKDRTLKSERSAAN